MFKKNDYLESKSIRVNVDMAVEAVTACLQVLDITNKVYELIRDGQRFAALKSMDDLQNIHLKEVQDFGFAQLINKNVPALTQVVRSDSLADLDAWIQNIGELSKNIGYAAFEHVGLLRENWRKIQNKKQELRKYKFNSPVELSYRESNFNYLNNSKVKETLSSLYECSLIHTSLGLSISFHEHFDIQIKPKKEEIVPVTLPFDVSSVESMKTTLQKLQDIFASAAGFEIIDKTISRQIKGLRKSEAVDEFWIQNSQKLISKFKKSLEGVSDKEFLADLRSYLILFTHTVEIFNFDVSSLYSFIIDLFKHFILLSKAEFVKNFTNNLDNDDYMPMMANSFTEYNDISKRIWCKNPIIEGELVVFPRMLYFSPIYLVFCTGMQKFIDGIENFMSDLNVDPCLIEDLIQEIIDLVLVDNVCAAFKERLSSTTREKIVQILLNLEHFEYASTEIEKELEAHKTSGRSTPIILKSTDAFKEARKLAEARIFELVNAIVDDFLDIADYDWLTNQRHTEPSSYLTEMINFLKTMVNSTLVNLPHNVKSFLYLDAFDHLAASLLKFLIEASDSLTPAAVSNFDMDVRYLEKFVDDMAKDSNEMSLTTTFTELRQSIDLLRAEDMSEYNNTMTRMKKYDRVKPENAQALFYKAANAVRQQHPPNSANHSPANSINASTGFSLKQYYKTGVDKFKK